MALTVLPSLRATSFTCAAIQSVATIRMTAMVILVMVFRVLTRQKKSHRNWRCGSVGSGGDRHLGVGLSVVSFVKLAGFVGTFGRVISLHESWISRAR
jgi:hypothetical protein